MNAQVKEYANLKLEAEVVPEVDPIRTAVKTVRTVAHHYHDHVFVNIQKNQKESEEELVKDPSLRNGNDYQESRRHRKEKDMLSQDRKARTRLLARSRISFKDKERAAN